ncbi:unnamed protein product [Orchesella dallaii]|uniref:Uncharacterized protein n=1 Tax=Orchesella dallaii TaxID=48710 RepID=A0ABP1RD25_9HEXA
MEGVEKGRELSSSKTRRLEGHCEIEEQSLEQLEIHETSDKRSHYIYYLKIFLDLGYFLLVIPFRLKLKTDRIVGRKIYKLHHNKLQQITCAFFQIIVIFELFSILRLVPSFKEMQKKPLNILQSGNLVASLIYTLSLVYIFWFKRSNVENICVLLQDVEHLSANTRSEKWKRIQVIILSTALTLLRIGTTIIRMSTPTDK